MAMNVELREKPRVFEVWVGENSIGQVTSYIDDNYEDDCEEMYEAKLYKPSNDDKDDTDIELGWYSTLRLAAQQVIDYAHGDGKIDAVVKRKA